CARCDVYGGRAMDYW
nr:immunoglobulin heavy chain junction region [Mus musculus]